MNEVVHAIIGVVLTYQNAVGRIFRAGNDSSMRKRSHACTARAVEIAYKHVILAIIW